MKRKKGRCALVTIYSKKIISFISEIKKTVKEILTREVGADVGKDYFYYLWYRSYPINVVIYNDARHLGYFDPIFCELGFHECLAHTSREQLHNVIRHELAHYLIFINQGLTYPAHSDDFKLFCIKMGWSEEVQRATLRVDGADAQAEESTVLRKVKKLLALATSSNIHESESAMLKSQQLLLKHHMETPSVDEEDDEKVVLKRILKQKRANAKTHAIGNILMTFFVSVVYTRNDDYTYVEILGDTVNVDIAEYVAGVLDHQLDILWDQAQKGSPVRGRVAKNSFFRGVAKGYCDKVHALERTSAAEMSNALMIIQKKLDDATAMVYPHVTFSRNNSLYCREASLLGEKMGKQLSINPAINKTSERSEKLLLDCQN